MRRREPDLTPLELAEGLTPELLLGPCVEVWCPSGYHHPEREYHSVKLQRAHTAWRQAASAYLHTIGVPYPSMIRVHPSVPQELAQVERRPWSFGELAATDPDELTRRLANAGLPATWRPPSSIHQPERNTQ